MGLPPNINIPLSIIWNRKQTTIQTLMSQVEPHLVTLVCAMAQAQSCL